MTSLPPDTERADGAADYGFPLVRRGYDRAAVDEFARSAHAEITQLRHSYETLAAHYAELQAASATAPPAADFSGLGGRAQEILRIAEEQARDLTGRATADADRLTEQTEHEVQLLRDSATDELAELRSTELARLETLRTQSEREAAAAVGAATEEAAQLLGAARLEAGAVRAEAENNARATVQTARLQATTVLADADRDALQIRQEVAAQREEVLAQLTVEADDLRGRIEQTLADSTRMHGESAAHLRAEADEAGRRRAESLAEAERLRSEAAAESEQLVARARQQAATVEERARQEFAWRRRQLRQEQDLLTRRKQAMLSQLASLSALAVETAEGMPEVPALDLEESEPAVGAPEPSPVP